MKRSSNVTVPEALMLDKSIGASVYRVFAIISLEDTGEGTDLSYSQIAKKAGTSKSSVVSAIRYLLDKEYIRKEKVNKLTSFGQYADRLLFTNVIVSTGNSTS